MSIPLLTPLDSPIWDEDVIRDLEEHHDDVAPCIVEDGPATVSLVMRCCGTSFLVCERHFAKARRSVEAKPLARCRTCRLLYVAPAFDDDYRVVPL